MTACPALSVCCQREQKHQRSTVEERHAFIRKERLAQLLRRDSAKGARKNGVVERYRGQLPGAGGCRAGGRGEGVGPTRRSCVPRSLPSMQRPTPSLRRRDLCPEMSDMFVHTLRRTMSRLT